MDRSRSDAGPEVTRTFSGVAAERIAVQNPGHQDGGHDRDQTGQCCWGLPGRRANALAPIARSRKKGSDAVVRPKSHSLKFAETANDRSIDPAPVAQARLLSRTLIDFPPPDATERRRWRGCADVTRRRAEVLPAETGSEAR